MLMTEHWSLTRVVLQGRCRLDASLPTRTRHSSLRASCPASPACWAQWLSSDYSFIAFSPQPPTFSAGKAAPLAPASRRLPLMMFLVVRAAEHRPRTPNPAPSGRGGRSVLITGKWMPVEIQFPIAYIGCFAKRKRVWQPNRCPRCARHAFNMRFLFSCLLRGRFLTFVQPTNIDHCLVSKHRARFILTPLSLKPQR
jgi:hypothetical protein